LRNIWIELGGTAALVYFTNWANVLYLLGQIKLSSLALVYGLIVSVLIYVAQDKSGAHFDPSVTVGLADEAQLLVLQQDRLQFGDSLHSRSDRRRSVRWFPDRQTLDSEPKREIGVVWIDRSNKGPLGIPAAESEDDIMRSFFLETFAVMIITIVRVSLMIDSKKFRDVSGVAVGAAYSIFVMTTGPLSGACLNPSRSLGTLFILDQVAANGQFLLALAPFAGSITGMYIYRKFLISEQLQDELEVL
jgi:glycerol uptake facilitator-like aquaporin